MTWIKKKIGPGIYNITTTEDAERVLTSENKVVLGFLESLVVCIAYSSMLLFTHSYWLLVLGCCYVARVLQKCRCTNAGSSQNE